MSEWQRFHFVYFRIIWILLRTLLLLRGHLTPDKIVLHPCTSVIRNTKKCSGIKGHYGPNELKRKKNPHLGKYSPDLCNVRESGSILGSGSHDLVTEQGQWLGNDSAQSPTEVTYQILCCRVLCSVARLCLTATPWTVVRQTSLSMGFFSRQEYWSGLPFPPPGDPGPKDWPASLVSPALADRVFTTELTGEALIKY